MQRRNEALAYLPYGCWWSTPFAKWQGTLSELHSLRFGARVASAALAERQIDLEHIDYGVLGSTVPQRSSFYGLPWLAGMLGAPHVSGPTIAQACATGTRILANAADEINRGSAEVCLALAADRVSNGPHVIYPSSTSSGGSGTFEHWTLDNFAGDPFVKLPMVQTAENVAAEFGISTEEQNDVTLLRYAQYQEALSNNQAFQRRYMVLPLDVPDRNFRQTVQHLDGDEGVTATTADGLARLNPVVQGGTVTFGGQTHPADGSAGVIVTTASRAADMSRDRSIAVGIVSFGSARERPGFMPAAPIPAAKRALDDAGVTFDDIAAIKTHNPFVVNDIAFARAFDLEQGRINNFGSPLIWGHPQGPTALRAIIELIEELAIRGGGYGLFAGCAAGDSAMATVIKVGDPS